MLKTCNRMATSAFVTFTNFETGSKLPEFSGIVVTTRANQYLNENLILVWEFHLELLLQLPWETPI